VRYAELVEVYEELSRTSKRLEIRAALVRLLKAADPEELPEVLYLSQGLLRPEYEGIELGMADALARRAVAEATGSEEAIVERAVRRSGDLGTTAEELLAPREASHSGQRSLSVQEVYDACMAIARASGSGSQEAKNGLLTALLARASPTEAKYIVRFVLGKLRLGVREMTILDALNEAFAAGTKADRAEIEDAFNRSSDLGLVARALVKDGVGGMKQIELEVGRPVRAMLAERSRDLEELLERLGGEAAVEYKYDGLRVQAHVPAHGPVKLFSRRLEDISDQFPELLAELPKALRRRPAIVEGECVAIDPQTEEIRPFQEISRRRGRKYDIERMQEEVPVRLFLFDILLDPKGVQAGRPLPERRKILEGLLGRSEKVHLATQEIVRSVEGAQRFLDAAIASGCEGLMAKSIAKDSIYKAGARGFLWIKYKRDYTQGLVDSIDGVVVGAFDGRGRRAGRYGALLLAVYNPDKDRFESFTKIGTGFDDATLERLPKMLQPYERADRPANVLTMLEPDHWLDPGLVLEVQGAELSISPNHRAAVGIVGPESGLALRFPRFTGRFRSDKAPTDATTTQELLRLYRSQVRQAPTRSDDPPET
jgi:DNA ligase-1